MRTIIIPAGRTLKNLNRLTKWAKFNHDFAGRLESPKWWGHKIQMSNGSVIVNLWPKPPTSKG